jgi:hypothetical protein
MMVHGEPSPETLFICRDNLAEILLSIKMLVGGPRFYSCRERPKTNVLPDWKSESDLAFATIYATAFDRTARLTALIWIKARSHVARSLRLWTARSFT